MLNVYTVNRGFAKIAMYVRVMSSSPTTVSSPVKTRIVVYYTKTNLSTRARNGGIMARMIIRRATRRVAVCPLTRFSWNRPTDVK